MAGPVWRRTLVLVAAAALWNPTRATAQLPFDLTEEDLRGVEAAGPHFTSVRTYVGGAEAELRYSAEEATAGECRAAALLGTLRLRRRYQDQRGEAPVSLRMAFRCGTAYRGEVVFDGLVVRLELRDGSSGSLIYRGRWRGFR